MGKSKNSVKVKSAIPKPHEIIWLGIDDPALQADHLIPFAFLLTDEESVMQCFVSDVGGELALDKKVSDAIEDALEMMVHHLCAESRPDLPDHEILRCLTLRSSLIRIESNSVGLMLDAEGEQRLLLNEGNRLILRFIKSRTCLSETMKDIYDLIDSHDTMGLTTYHRSHLAHA